MSPKVGIGLFLLCGLVPAASASPAVMPVPITVSTTSDTVNGDTSSVEALLVRPGRDGISLREALEATNKDPGVWTIRFAPTLRGKTILVQFWLPKLIGGGVTIEGRGVTLRRAVRSPAEIGLWIASSRNRVQGLALEGFYDAVEIRPDDQPHLPLPTGLTLARNVVSGLVIRDAFNGINIRSAYSRKCGIPKSRPCRSFNRVVDTTIIGNRIEARNTAIGAGLQNSGDRVERLTVIGNVARITDESSFAIGVEHGSDAGDDGTPAVISDVLIARNRITGTAAAGISVGTGHRAQGNQIRRVRVLDNRVHLVRRSPDNFTKGIWVMAGGEASDGVFAEVRPLRYPDRNVTRDVEVRGNTVTGTLELGVGISTAGQAPGSRNRAEDVRIVRNTISSTLAVGRGVFVFTDSNGEPPGGTYAVGNRIARVMISSNRISVPGRAVYRPATAGAIVLLGGGEWSRDGSIRNVTIASNRIATSEVGVKVIGGIGGHARGNRVTCVRIRGNRVTGARTAVSVISNAEYASGNVASLGGC